MILLEILVIIVFVIVNIFRMELMLYAVNVTINAISVLLEKIIVGGAPMLLEILLIIVNA